MCRTDPQTTQEDPVLNLACMWRIASNVMWKVTLKSCYKSTQVCSLGHIQGSPIPWERGHRNSNRWRQFNSVLLTHATGGMAPWEQQERSSQVHPHQHKCLLSLPLLAEPLHFTGEALKTWKCTSCFLEWPNKVLKTNKLNCNMNITVQR